MARDITKTFLVGRLTRDAELTPITEKFSITKFSIACNYVKKIGDEWVEQVSYFDIEHINSRITQYLEKGKRVAIEATPRQDRWEDKETRKARSKVYFLADNIELLDSKNGNVGVSENVQTDSALASFNDNIPW